MNGLWSSESLLRFLVVSFLENPLPQNFIRNLGGVSSIENGGVLIDTPGMRELQLWDSGEGFKQSFNDIETIAVGCRFRDCKHEEEPGCAVRKAINEGVIDQGRYASYLKLLKEMAFLERKSDVKAQLAEKQKWKQRTKLAKQRY